MQQSSKHQNSDSFLMLHRKEGRKPTSTTKPFNNSSFKKQRQHKSHSWGRKPPKTTHCGVKRNLSQHSLHADSCHAENPALPKQIPSARMGGEHHRAPCQGAAASHASGQEQHSSTTMAPLQHLQAAPQTGPREKWDKLEVPAWEQGQTGTTPATVVVFGGVSLAAIPTGRVII